MASAPSTKDVADDTREHALAGETPTRVRYKVMAFLCVLSFLTYFDRVCIMRAQDDIRATLGITTQQMGWIMGAFWLSYALFEIPAGWMGDRFGTRVTLTRIVLAWSLFTALSGSAMGFVSLLTYRFLFGVGEAGAYPNMARVQSQWLPVQTRARWGGLLWLVARWGGAFSPVIFGAMLTAFDSAGFRNVIASVPGLSAFSATPSWRFAFWAAGLLGVVWCAAFYPWFRDNPADKPGVNEAERRLIAAGRSASAGSHAMPRRAWAALFTSRSLLAMSVLYLLASFGWSFFVSWAPKYLKDVHGVSFAKSELMTGLPLFIGGISCLVGGYLSDVALRLTGRKWICRAAFPITGYLVAAVAMLFVPYAKTPEQATWLLCIAAGAHDFGQGANWATIVDVGGTFAGVAAGLINLIGNQANFLQPVVGGYISEVFGWRPLFAVYCCTYLAAAAMWLLIDPSRKFYEDEQETPQGFPVIVKPGEERT